MYFIYLKMSGAAYGSLLAHMRSQVSRSGLSPSSPPLFSPIQLFTMQPVRRKVCASVSAVVARAASLFLSIDLDKLMRYIFKIKSCRCDGYSTSMILFTVFLALLDKHQMQSNRIYDNMHSGDIRIRTDGEKEAGPYLKCMNSEFVSFLLCVFVRAHSSCFAYGPTGFIA